MPADLGNCKVLLVDDTKTNIDVLVQALRDDYKIGVALNGEKALEYARRKKPDLILLDIMMPGISGFDVCQTLKSEDGTQSIPVIFITAMDDPKHKAAGFATGAVDYITKPFDVMEVKARVKTHLALKVASQSLKNQNRKLESMVKERTLELENTQRDIVNRLGMAAEFHDWDTGMHINRITGFFSLMARAYGLPEREIEVMSLASTMHDVGKIGISDTILLKPGKLTPEEFEIIKTHTTIGASLLSGSDSPLLQLGETIALTHHERWDGTGYPNGLAGGDIPLPGRICCICDVFDALISKRPYKKAWPVAEAIEEIEKQSGKLFDPTLVKIFLANEDKVAAIALAAHGNDQH